MKQKSPAEALVHSGSEEYNRTVPRYIEYEMAIGRLHKRLKATPEELAVWVFYGSKQGGLDAYRNANELDPPPRFFFEPEMSWDYLSHLRWCWFLEADIEGFSPDERYITGAALIQRWSHRSYQEPRQLLLKLVTESRLMDIHPITGLTEGSEVEGVPPIEEGLFPLSLVEQIDADFGMDPEQHLAEIGTEAWRKKIAKAAAEARHNRKGGSRDKRKQIQEIWATGKYSTRDACAEAELDSGKKQQAADELAANNCGYTSVYTLAKRGNSATCRAANFWSA